MFTVLRGTTFIVSNNKLSCNNLASDLMENWTFLKPITREKGNHNHEGGNCSSSSYKFPFVLPSHYIPSKQVSDLCDFIWGGKAWGTILRKTNNGNSKLITHCGQGMTKTNAFSYSNRRRSVEHHSNPMAIRSCPVAQATTTRGSHSNIWAISRYLRARTSCTHFSNLKRKMTILIALDGKGKTSVWLQFRALAGYVETRFRGWEAKPFRCTCPTITNELHWCVSELSPVLYDNEYPWFKFEPAQ